MDKKRKEIIISNLKKFKIINFLMLTAAVLLYVLAVPWTVLRLWQ